MRLELRPTYSVLAAVLSLGCVERFETQATDEATAGDTGGPRPGGTANATTGGSGAPPGAPPPPAPSTTSGGPDDPNPTTGGGDCVEDETVCAPGSEPLLLLCENGSWSTVPQSHPSGAGDCDGVCREATSGAFVASGCVEGECVCDRLCPANTKGWGWEQGYCADDSTFWSCVGDWAPVECATVCEGVCGGAQGWCDPGASSGKDYFDTCVCDLSACGSCRGACGFAKPVRDGDANCYCDDACATKGDCCHDYDEQCLAKAPPGDEQAEHLTEADPMVDAVPVDADLFAPTWPSLRAYPRVTQTLLTALAGEDPVARLAGLRDAFAGPEWPKPRTWNRFGAIQLDGPVGFVSLEGGDMPPLDGVSLGCLGGFVEATRVLDVPRLRLSTVLHAARGCPDARPSDDTCSDVDHTGLHVLLNLRDEHLPTWSVRLVDADDATGLQSAFEASPDPYYVSASHVGRNDGKRRYHHMALVIVDASADVSGPLIFDTTGRRGVSLRRVTWESLAHYLGVALAGGTRYRYSPRMLRVAVLHSGRNAD